MRVRASIVTVEKQWVLQQPECVFVTLGIRHAMRISHIAICGLPRSTNFFSPHFLLNDKIFEKKDYWNQNVHFLFLYNFCLNHFSF